MRRPCCLCLVLTVLCCMDVAAIAAQQTGATKPAQETPADAVPKPEEAAADEAEEPAAATMVLPPGVDPNPPKPEDLKRDGLTWKGEYELGKLNRPVRDVDGKPVPVLYTKKGKRTRPRGVHVLRMHPAEIVDGTLVVDGWANKAQLQYDIQDLRYLYVSVPTIGTVVISPSTFPGAEEQHDAFKGNELTVKVDDHEIQLVTEKPILGSRTQAAWVKVDTQFVADRRNAVFGFGARLTAPYEWPGAQELTQSGSIAPPVPVNMRPKMAIPICIAQPGKPCVTKAPPAAPAESPAPAPTSGGSGTAAPSN